MAGEVYIRRAAFFPLVISVFALTADLRGQEALAWYRFEEGVGGEGEEVIDDVTGDAHGLVLGSAFFVPDAAPIQGGPPNDASIDFTQGGSLAIDGITFPFHDFAFGGAVGDATLEWFMKAPGPTPPGHAALFWTGPEESRFHIYWEAIAAGDRKVTGDWKHASPVPNLIVGSHESGVPLELDLWHSVAIVRTALGGANEFRWEWYFNGELRIPRTVETTAPLPDPLDWTVNGRGGFSFRGFMDEIRLTEGIPDDFLLVDRPCPAPDAGDTHCVSFAVDPLEGPQGTTFNATLQASDDSGDTILYTITAVNELGEVVERTPADGVAGLPLSEGTWTILGSVDDDTLCSDSAADRACDPVVVEVGPAGARSPVLWWRFEDQGGNSGIDVTEENDGVVDGSSSNNEMFVTDPVPDIEIDGQSVTNEGALDFRNGDRVTMDGKPPFVFHDPLVGGSDGDATLEFLVYPPALGGSGSPAHSALFWTRTGNVPNDNRMHIFWDANHHGGGDPDSDRWLTGDWALGGTHRVGEHEFGVPLELDRWHHVAIVRTSLGGFDEHRWEWYFNGFLNGPQTSETAVPLPNEEVWTLNGRGSPFHFSGLMDEIRMNFDTALEPDEFIVIDHFCPVEEGNPDDGDTHCLSLTVVGPADNGPGTYTATAEGADDTDDELIYTFMADNGAGQTFRAGPDVGVSEASFVLTEGTWTVTASVDDTLDCRDVADDMTCEEVVEVAPCPAAGDTHCQSFTFAGPREGGAEGTPGTYRLSATATDDGGDNDLMYTFTVEDGFGGVETKGPQSEPEADFFLFSGTWTFRVEADDHAICDDQAGDAVCEVFDFEIEGDLPPTQFYLRFEGDEGSTDVIDDLTGAVVGELIEGAVRSPETPGPVPLTGAANGFSVDFGAGGFVNVDGLGFIFHDESVRGATGDATLEFYLFTQNIANHSALFWTGPEGVSANRMHIYWGANFTGAPDSNRFVVGDWVRPGNGLTNIAVLDSGFPLEVGEWHHIAVVRTALGVPGEYRWEWYFDGVRNDSQTAETTAPLPDWPGAWTINGRGDPFHFPGALDEIRGVSEALTPESFLIGDGRCVPDEPDGEISCEDGIDNDCDTLTDAADEDCQRCTPTEETETMCEDGIDNDCDTLTDAADEDCQPAGVGPFVRGDCDGNGTVGGSPTEAIVLLNFAFRGGPAPSCLAACDAEANGSIGITDALRILRHSFLGQGEPDAPFPDCVKSDLASDVDLDCEQPFCLP